MSQDAQVSAPPTMVNAVVLLDRIEGHLAATPPPGISPGYVQTFIARNRWHLLETLEHRILPFPRPVGGDRVVTLNCGLGRDSIAMLCLLLEGRLVAQRTVVRLRDITAVVFSDTGAEWSFTYAVLPLVAELCRQAGLRFITLQKPPEEGEHGWKHWLEVKPATGTGERTAPIWRQAAGDSIEERARTGYYHLRPPILEDYKSRCTVVSLNRQDCTSNHKILPLRRLIEDLARERFGTDSNRTWGADVRAGRRRPHLTLIGYAADETHRLGHEAGPDYVEEAFPLMELGVTKDDEAEILERWHLGQVQKSGCKQCPFQPVDWYWALRETDPESWQEVLAYEAASVSRNPNMTVLPGGPRLEIAVERWRKANPDVTVEDVLSKAYARCKKEAREKRKADRKGASVIEVLEAPYEARPDPLFVAVQARVLLRSRGTALA